MRIALVSQEYPPETAHGGISSQTYAKAHGLSALGHEVHVLSHSLDRHRHETFDGPVQVTRIPGPGGFRDEIARWLDYSAAVAVELAELHARSPLELVDFPEWASEGYVHLLDRAELADVPVVIQLHGPLVMFAHALGWPDPRSEFFRLGKAMEGACLHLADAVYSSSRCSRAWCVEHHGLAGGPIPILHTGIDVRFFHGGLEARDERPTILFAGRIERSKGVEALLDAACEAAREHEDLVLRMLGRGNPGLQRELLARAAARGLPELLEFTGHVDRESLRRHLGRAHVFAAPSRYEGGPGFVYLEAMACGLPVIACAGSGASEVVEDGANGFLVPPDDRGTLAAVLKRLLADAELRARMGARAREFVLAEADTELCLRRMEAFYAGVVHAGARRW